MDDKEINEKRHERHLIKKNKAAQKKNDWELCRNFNHNSVRKPLEEDLTPTAESGIAPLSVYGFGNFWFETFISLNRFTTLLKSFLFSLLLHEMVKFSFLSHPDHPAYPKCKFNPDNEIGNMARCSREHSWISSQYCDRLGLISIDPNSKESLNERMKKLRIINRNAIKIKRVANWIFLIRLISKSKRERKKKGEKKTFLLWLWKLLWV